jgi:hypothetical protein
VGLAIDFFDQGLADILDEAMALTRGESASIMLTEVGGKQLRVAAAKGLNEGLVAKARGQVGEGIAGQAFATRTPAISCGEAPSLAEMNGRPVHRIAASVPVMISERSIGVLSVNATSEEAIAKEDILAPLSHLARDLPAALLAAIDLQPLPKPQRWAAFECLIDRIMSLEEELPTRLAAAAKCLRKVVGSDDVRFYWLDPLSGELHETPRRRSSVGEEATRPPNREFLAKVMRQDQPEVLEVTQAAGKATTIYHPIRSSHPHSLMVLENIHIGDHGQDNLLFTLQEVIGNLEAMIIIEESLAVQELLSDLRMRIADLPQLDKLPTPKRIRALIDIVHSLIPAEVVIWIPPDQTMPTMIPSPTPNAVRIQRWASEHLERLADWARVNGAAAQGMVATCWDAEAPKGPASYTAIPDQEGKGVLLVFFGSAKPNETRHVSSSMVWQVLSRLCSLIAGGREDVELTRQEQPDVLSSEAHRVLTAPVLAKLVHHEFMRSCRYGHPWSLVRIRLAIEGPDIDRSSQILQRFLLQVTRQVDLIAEINPGVFVILLPHTGALPNLILQRLTAKWESGHPDLKLDADQRNFPEAGDPDAIYGAWITAQDQSAEAA